MNYFCHAWPFLDEDPYFVAGTALPDWLTVSDRQVRLRPRDVMRLREDPNPKAAALAAGALQHFADDAHFHNTRAFAETSLALTALVRDALAAETGFRPSFLGHLLVEVLLDAELLMEDRSRLEAYYQKIAEVDPADVQDMVNRVAARPAARLALLVPGFLRERFFDDYVDDDRLFRRLNQVMRRVGLEPLPSALVEVFPIARRLVQDRQGELRLGLPAVVGEPRLA